MCTYWRSGKKIVPDIEVSKKCHADSLWIMKVSPNTDFLAKGENFHYPGGNTPQDTNCTVTCPLSRKLFKLDEPDMQDTAEEAGTNS